MADIQVRIQLQDTIPDEITGFETTTKTNNASSANIVSDLAKADNGVNMKSWATPHVVNGETVLGLSLKDGVVGGADTKLVSQNGYNGYVFGAVSEDKELLVDIFVMGDNIDSIIVYGDQTANQFPTRAYLNNDTSKVIYSDDAVWAIKFDTPASSQRITFTHWNRANYNACITAINRLDNTLVLDKAWIQSLDSLSQATGQPKEIYYGVTANRGSLSVLDVNGELLDYINDGIINPNDLPVDIYANGKKLQSHICSSLNYSTKAFLCNAELTSKEESKFSQTINLKDYRTSPISLKEVLVNYVYNGQNIDEMLTNETSYYDNTTQTNVFLSIDEYLQNIKTDFIYFYDESPSTILNWICQATQMALVEQVDGSKKFISLRPLRNNKKQILVNKSKMFSSFERDVIVNNIYDKVNITSEDVAVSIDNVFDKTYKLKTEDGYGTYWYDPSAIGLDAKFNKYEADYFGYSMTFFDTLSYKNNEFYDLSKAICVLTKNLPRSVAPVGDTIEVNSKLERVSLSFSNRNKDEYSLPTITGVPSSVTLTNADSPHDNKEPYIFAIFLNIDPFRGADAVNYGYNSVNLAIQATKYTIEENISEWGNGDKEYSIRDNPFVSKSVILTHNNINQPIGNIIANNILHDYEKGVKTAKVSVGCLDYNDINGNIVKNWQNGDILDVGDILTFEDEKGTWIITGRNFRYAGVPMLDLELQEVKLI
jgi:hypothetical protein